VNDWKFGDREVARAQQLLKELLPDFRSRDEVLDNLYYVTPNANPEVRTWSIAAAVAVLLRSQ
jgi:hypothetical protein